MKSTSGILLVSMLSLAATGIVACGGGEEPPDAIDDAAGDVSTDVPGDAADDTTVEDARDASAGFNQIANPWPERPEPPESALFSDYGLGAFNSYVGRVDWQYDGDDPVVQYDALGFYGIGNGHTFSLVGTDYPLSVLHETVGPDYDRPELETYPDIRMIAVKDGARFKFTTSRIGRFSKTSIVGVTSVGGGLRMSSVFLSPQTDDAGLDTAVLAVVRLENTGSATMENLTIAVNPKSGSSESGTPGVLVVNKGVRNIYMVYPDATWDSATKRFAPAAFTLEPGQSREFVIWLFTTDGDAAVDPAPGFLSKAAATDVAAVISQTVAWWNNWFAQGLQIELDDQGVTDLLESFLYTIKAQITHDGAMTPLSHYGEYWTRDLSGAVRMFAISSRTDEIEAMLNYHHVAACAANGFFNASKVNWPMGQPCAVTDWSSLPVMEEKTAAEAPSYVVHMYNRLFDATGDNSLILEREAMLRYGLQKQAFNADYLLPFSDDETFRPALAMNTGIGGPEFMFATEYWSLQSTLLYIAAADGLVRAIGYDENDEITKLRDSIAATIDTYYWQEDLGIFAPILKMGTLEPYLHPYEDVNLTASWMNLEDWLGNNRVKRDIDVLVSESWMPDLGVIQTNRGNLEPLLGYDLSLGIATGMTPGFTLYALARHRPDLAEKAFNVFPHIVTPSGNVTEDFATKGFRPLMPAYDPDGTFGEIWARFRPWEGGQDGEAILFYLTGLYSNAAWNRVTLAPHLPNNLSHARYEGLLADGCRIDMDVTEIDEKIREYVLNFTGPSCDTLIVTLKTAVWSCGERDDCTASPMNMSGAEEYDYNPVPPGAIVFRAKNGAEYVFKAMYPIGTP